MNKEVARLYELASDFRSSLSSERVEAITAYQAHLNYLLKSGWRDFLDPESELPDEFMPAAYLAFRDQPPAGPQHLLKKLTDAYDPVLMQVLNVSSRRITGRIARIYSALHLEPSLQEGSVFDFMGASSAWGNIPLRNDSQALVFLRGEGPNPRYSQRSWRGHFEVEAIAGVMYAIANWDLLDGPAWEPAELHGAAFTPHPLDRRRVAIPYELLERHLVST